MLASTFAGLYVLAALACPVGMGLMTVFMGKGMLGGKARDRSAPEMQDEQQSLAALRTEQARLAEKVATLERRAADPGGLDGKQARHASVEQQWSERTPA